MAQKPKIRYVHANGTVFPDVMFDLYSTPHDIERQVCHMDSDDNEQWEPLGDKPRPGIVLQQKSQGVDNFEPVADFDSLNGVEGIPDDDGYVEPYDTYVDRYASDFSGGPSNFHGNGGGDDNPREVSTEEVTDYNNRMAEYAEQLPESDAK